MSEIKISISLSKIKELLNQQIEICEKRASQVMSSSYPAFRNALKNRVDETTLNEIKQEVLNDISKSKFPEDISVLDKYLNPKN